MYHTILNEPIIPKNEHLVKFLAENQKIVTKTTFHLNLFLSKGHLSISNTYQMLTLQRNSKTIILLLSNCSTNILISLYTIYHMTCNSNPHVCF